MLTKLRLKNFKAWKDSWGWQTELARIGVTIHFLCEHDIAKKHRTKMRK